MYRIEILAHLSPVEIIFDKEYLISKLECGDYKVTFEKIQEPKTVEEYRAEYFAKRDILAAETGNSKKDMHEEAKKRFLKGGSTKDLNQEEWKTFISQFKEWAFEHFNCYL